jgi:hypothetical protein
MDEVVAPDGLHNKLPEAVVDKAELPQLLTTITVGVVGAPEIAAVPLPGALVQLLALVAVTVYAPDVVTVIEALD